jgi:hypothetical protein
MKKVHMNTILKNRAVFMLLIQIVILGIYVPCFRYLLFYICFEGVYYVFLLCFIVLEIVKSQLSYGFINLSFLVLFFCHYGRNIPRCFSYQSSSTIDLSDAQYSFGSSSFIKIQNSRKFR